MVYLRWCMAGMVAMCPVTLWGEGIHFVSPAPMQIFQREGFVPREAHPHAVGEPAIGFADVPLIIHTAEELLNLPSGHAEVLLRVSNTRDASQVMDKRVTLQKKDQGSWVGSVRLPAGGWYKIELESKNKDQTVSGSMEPVGVGEVFLIAGQSYATNTNDEKMLITDREKRVAAWNFRDGTWRTADDPQPTPDGSDGGSIWPPVGDHLAGLLNVPIGFANVAWGGTSSDQWLPAG